MTASQALPNLWHIYNLRESPYFQETLGGDPDRYPLHLFVGRAHEVKQLLATIGSSASSRQATGGAPGVGKTTLVQSVKADALAAGYWTTDRLVPFYPDDTAEDVLGRMLAGLYDAILTARPMTADNTGMQAAQQLVRASRFASGGLNVSALGIGAGVTRGQTVHSPAGAMLLDGPRVIRDLLSLVRASGAKGVVLHLNNLENMSERDAAHAADMLRSIRDTVLLQDGLHIILAGTTEAVLTVTGAHAQIRSVFATPLTLDALPVSELQRLLTARYKHLALDSARVPVPPVAPGAVAALYPLFRGDLRSLFKALEEGAMLLIGVGAKPGKPIPLSELLPALKQRYSVLLNNLDARRQAQLKKWARHPASGQTQKSLMKLWQVSQPAVSTALVTLERDGFVVSMPERGSATQYALSGASRLIFG